MPAAAHSDALDQLPELATRQRIDAGRRLVEDQQVGIVDQRAAQPELLPHAARQFLRRTVGEWRKPGAVEQFGDALPPFGAGLSEQAAEKLDVFADAEIGIEVLAQALRHIGDARTDRGAMRGIGHVAVEHIDLAGLDLPRAGNDGAASDDLPTPSGPISPTMQPPGNDERNVVEGDGLAVTLA